MSALPEEVGIAADLVAIADARVLLTNSLVIHEKVVIPVDAATLHFVSTMLGAELFYGLVDSERIEFCPSFTAQSITGQGRVAFSKGAFLEQLLSSPLLDFLGERSRLERAVVDHLIVPMTPTYDASDDARRAAERRFVEISKLPGHEALGLERQVGLRLGMARINDLLQVGYGALEFDTELPVLLSYADPMHARAAVSSEEIIGELHRIANLPDLGALAALESWTDKRLLSVLQSQEASDLRSWLRKNLAPGMDVREAYDAADRNLPSRNAWAGWMRFGTVTAVSTAVSSLIGGPVLGAAAGAVVGAADQAFGARIMDAVSWKYHPNKWNSFVSRSRPS
ncbi:hypothetical protein [Stenotrophomonas cyclobalanopsidis]|uniref:hypothetical protein n=1 Tax=Stenotrophomonas cyclobalanopsidis TaxID=2771362 RepID=UPI00345F9139